MNITDGVTSMMQLFSGMLIWAMLMGFVMIGLFIFWILMIVDCIQRKFKDDTEKVVWILVLLFTYFIGALIYYFIVKRKGKKGKR